MKRISFLTIILVLLFLSAPALAGNTLTVTGDVIPPVQPFADFTGNPTSGTPPLTVHFTDQSTGTITSWAWDFQDDGIVDSHNPNPVHTYTTAGTYTVSLVVTGPGGSDQEIKTGYITVNVPVRRPIARFTQNQYVGRPPLTVQFTDRSLFKPTDYLWWFGDGTTSIEKNPQHIYTSRGIYPVRLRVSNAAGSDISRSLVIVLRGGSW